MRVTIHQPNFLPWMGFFAKWASVDLFILLDNVPFTKGGYQNRVHIATPNGVSWLTVPVMTKKHLGQDSRDVAINPTKRWTKKHLKTLELSYRKYPFFDEVFPFMKETYAKSWVHLLPLNISLLESCAKKLHIEVPYVCASQYDLPPETGSKRLAQLVEGCGRYAVCQWKRREEIQ